MREKLNKAQREAVEVIDGPVVVVAGAGTGKTRTIVHRVLHLLESGIEPESLLCVTFTNKAAKEMRKRTAAAAGKERAERLTVCTIHSLCVRILREDITARGRDGRFTICDASDQATLVRRALVEHGFDPQKYDPRLFLARISRVKGIYPQVSLDDISDPVLRRVYAAYSNMLEASNMVDFDDLLLYAAEALEKTEIRDKYDSRWRYVMVDEFQDTNELQYYLIRRLTIRNKNLYVVGDDDQSIYGWRGAALGNILDFEKDFTGAKIVKLEENYRSTMNIINAAGAVIANNEIRRQKKLWTTGPEGDLITIVAATDDTQEASLVVERIVAEKSRKNLRFGDFAVLFRTNAQSRPIEQKLAGLGITYIMVGGVRFFERKEVKDLTAYFRLLQNPLDEEALTRVLNNPPRGIGESSKTKVRELAIEKKMPMLSAVEAASDDESFPSKARAGMKKFLWIMNETGAALNGKGMYAAAKKLIETAKIREHLQTACKEAADAERRIENVEEWANAVLEYSLNEPSPTLTGFLERVALMTEKEEDSETELKEDSVVLMTVHSAKGLEFTQVFIVGVEEGYMPHDRSLEEGSEEEERRLFYVAMTRAKKKLFISYAMNRKRYGETLRRIPSRFIEEIPARLKRFETTEESEDIREEVNQHAAVRGMERMKALFD